MLPKGAHTALTRVSLRDRDGGIAEYTKEQPAGLKHDDSLDKVYVDCGGSGLRTLSFAWRDHSGNLVPLGETDWSAQLCFGYPTS